MECLFCEIVKGKIPSQKVYEDQEILAIKDISPQAPIHYLFIPKKHSDSLDTMSFEDMKAMSAIYRAIQTVAKKEGFSSIGYRTAINTNKGACQTVFHLHVHCLAGKQLGGNMVGV